MREAQEAIEQHKIKGPGSVDFDGILARLRDALEHDPEKWEPVFGKIMLKQEARRRL